MRDLELISTKRLKINQYLYARQFLELWYNGINNQYLFDKLKETTEELKIRNANKT